MYRIGASSSCFYPQLTEDSFLKLCKMNIRTAEVFYNSPSELSPVFTAMLKSYADEYSVDVVAVHPFMSFAESFYLFSNYERRFHDLIPLYLKMFEAAAALGAKYFVFHGAKPVPSAVEEVYFERFAILSEKALEFGVYCAQENVVHYRSESPDFMARMKRAVGENFKMVLDIKQARRTGIDPFAFFDSVGESIEHIHISDYNETRDCITPLKGCFDFKAFFEETKRRGYKGDYIIELYRDSYDNEAEIELAHRRLCEIIAETVLK
ncbi:MAG: sugar phosphate isomerase/epimerase [Clostridiales bacterium]|nr:sugar phosphate isomerase/epimerase [Clostridiales bacterium]